MTCHRVANSLYSKMTVTVDREARLTRGDESVKL